MGKHGSSIAMVLFAPSPWTVDFVSSLALAQKASVTGSMERIAGIIGNMVPVFPEAKDLLDADDYIRTMNSLLCNPQTIIRSPEAVQQIRQMAAKQQAQAQQMAMTQHAATTANIGAQAGQTLADTQIGGGKSALEQLLGPQ